MMQSAAMARRGSEPDRRNPRPREVISRAANRMNRLIQDLLDVAQVETGRLRVSCAPVRVRALVIEAVEMQRPLASSSRLVLEVEVEGDPPDVFGDRDRLLQVFENLIGNAIKFTEPGGRIGVGAAENGREVLFSVSDTGCGIPAENQARIFEQFWQAAQHTGRSGSGLGLTISKGIVEAHGGRIGVESTPGAGSTFRFSIPTVAPKEEPPRAYAP
jgi:signal transduction histidine kinase